MWVEDSFDPVCLSPAIGGGTPISTDLGPRFDPNEPGTWDGGLYARASPQLAGNRLGYYCNDGLAYAAYAVGHDNGFNPTGRADNWDCCCTTAAPA